MFYKTNQTIKTIKKTKTRVNSYKPSNLKNKYRNQLRGVLYKFLIFLTSLRRSRYHFLLLIPPAKLKLKCLIFKLLINFLIWFNFWIVGNFNLIFPFGYFSFNACGNRFLI